ncbi:MAG: polymer-forming cytoskeletal protein [Elusimicrobia bacterium]|nr:polymer-forming cytoskeletal protein [Elusimicrobiota bacterium]
MLKIKNTTMLLLSLVLIPAVFLIPSFVFSANSDKKSVRIQVNVSQSDWGGIFKLNEDIHVPAHEKRDSVVAILGSAYIEGEVSEDVVVVGKKAVITGKVGGDTVVLARELELGPKSEIQGDLVILGTHVRKDPGAKIHGDMVSVQGFGLGPLLLGLTSFAGSLLVVLFWVKLIATVSWLVLAVILALLFPRVLTQTSSVLEQKFLKGLGIGILFWPAILLSSVGLAISILGLPLFPLLVAATIVLMLWGYLTAGHTVGRKLLKGLGTSSSVWCACLLGNFILQMFSWIPVLGKLVCLLATAAGSGATLLYLLSSKTTRVK